jgi:hypothetical protein
MGLRPYDKAKGTFATALETKLKVQRPHLSHLCAV